MKEKKNSIGRHFKTYDDLSFSDDFMFCKVMTDETLCKMIIRDILKIDVDKIEYLGKQQEINLDYNEISMAITANGNGNVLMEGMKLPSKNYKGKFFATKGMMLTAVSDAGSVFAGWSDGSIENPRLVQPAEGANFTAIFK